MQLVASVLTHHERDCPAATPNSAARRAAPHLSAGTRPAYHSALSVATSVWRAPPQRTSSARGNSNVTSCSMQW